MSLSYKAMVFARHAHRNQKRKYTGAPYAEHLAEVAGIVATVAPAFGRDPELMVAVAWLHDYIEDINPQERGCWGHWDIESRFGDVVADGVMLLSDLETGNRAERKEQSCARLAEAPGWVQTIKCADLISNTSSIVLHDPKFAITYLAEKRALLAVLTKADPRLRDIALELAEKC